MTELLELLNKNSGALTVLFAAVVTAATVVYAALTWVLVKETRMMREVQTEPKLQVTVSSFDFAINIVRLHVQNVGLGPALNVTFKPKVLAYSDPIRPLIPTQVGHPFRRNAATDSEVNPATFPSPLGIGGRHPVESWAG